MLVGVRSRQEGDKGQMLVKDFVNKIKEEIKNFTR